MGAVDHLIDLLSDDSHSVRFNAAEALGIIRMRAFTLAIAWSVEDEAEVDEQ